MTDQMHVRQRSPGTAIHNVTDRPNRTAVRQKTPWTTVPKVADHPHGTAVRQRSPWTAVLKVADHPYRTAVRVDTAGRRCFLVLLAFGVAIQAWALFPSTVESESYVALPEATAPTAADVNSARQSIVDNPLKFSGADAFTLMAAKLVSSNPTSYGLAAVGYSSPVVALSPPPLKAKLRMLLIQLSSMSGDMDLSALVAKLRALLELPDSALVAVLGLPEMADLNAMLDATSLGKVDLPGITKEMGKIELRSAPETPYLVEVAVNGKPTVRVDKRYAQNDSVAAAASAPAGAPAAAAGFVTVEAGVSVVASAVTPSVLRAAAPPPETFAPEAPALMMAMVAPETFAPETPAPMMATFAPETFAPETFAPETFAPETFAPETFAPETFAPETFAPETPTPTASTEVTVQGTPTSADVMDSGNKFEPGSTEANSGSDNSPPPQTAEPSTPATGGEGPPESAGPDDPSPRNNDGGGEPSDGGEGP